MSHPRVRRTLTLAASSLLIASAFASTAAASIQTTRSGQCQFPYPPLYTAQASTLALDLGVPENPVAGQTLSNTPVSATFTLPDYKEPTYFVPGPAWFEGTLTIGGIYTAPTAIGVDEWSATLTIPKTDWPSPSPLTATATGTLSALNFEKPGLKRFWLNNSYQLNLTAHLADGSVVNIPSPETDVRGNPFTDSDGDQNTFDVPCDTGFADLPFGQVTASAATTPTPTPAPPTPAPATPTPVPGNSCVGSTARYSYTLQGSTAINTLTKGSMPITGAIDAVLCVANGNYTATTVINDTQGRLTALGFLPVTVGIGIIPSGPTTGQLVDDQITANLKARIKVKSAKAFGAIPLISGNNCQSKELSAISLKSTGPFDPTATGGNIGGTFAISNLNGCGILEGLVSPLTAGGGNTITAKLTPKNS